MPIAFVIHTEQIRDSIVSRIMILVRAINAYERSPQYSPVNDFYIQSRHEIELLLTHFRRLTQLEDAVRRGDTVLVWARTAES
mgnify:CR=1 FL=1